MLDIPHLGYPVTSPKTQKSPKPGIFLVNRCKALKRLLQGLALLLKTTPFARGGQCPLPIRGGKLPLPRRAIGKLFVKRA